MITNKISIVGLGYVGLPLAVEFSKHYNVTGYDIDESRIKELSQNFDRTKEVTKNELKKVKNLTFTSDIEKIKGQCLYHNCTNTN